MDCIFCNIVQKNIPSQQVFEDDQCLAFNDINPKAPVHILVIPKQHITSLAHASEQDSQLLGHLLLTVKSVADEMGLDGFKTIINTGRSGGQVVDHLHIHLLGGKRFAE